MAGDNMNKTPRNIGTVRKLVRDKGYGFIIDENSKERVFFHKSALVSADYEDILPGTIMEYTLTEAVKGLAAEAILVVSDRD